MASKFKGLGLLLIALVALGATSASASAAEFSGNEATAIITGNQESTNPNVFTIGSAATRCEKAFFQGTATNPSASVTVRPEYNECELEGFGSEIPIVTNDCAYILDAGPTTNGDAPVHIECAASNKIEIKAPGCTISVGEQNPGGGVHYTTTNGASGKSEVTIQATVNNIAYSKSGALCFLISGSATYNGGVTAAGFKDEGNSGTSTTPNFTMGAQNSITQSE